ncbi:MAG: hemolysin family protein [Lachnospiraceae bacterium]|nr:hemolysin family protein [Lachnospiraceae bacterium]
MEDGASYATWGTLYLLVLLLSFLSYSFRYAQKGLSENVQVDPDGDTPPVRQGIKEQFLRGSIWLYEEGAASLGVLLVILQVMLILKVFPLESPENFGRLMAGITLHIIAGIKIPSFLGDRHKKGFADHTWKPVFALVLITSPVIAVLHFGTWGILRLFGVKDFSGLDDVTEEDIISLVKEGHEQGVIEESEAMMINNIFEFGDKEAKDIMTHRNKIVALDAQMTLSDAVTEMLNGSNSRYPVYEDSIDHIVGILHMKDAMRMNRISTNRSLTLKEIPGLLRRAVFIAETRKLDSLFTMMQATKGQMVVVIDEYGQTSGIVAMEDILEEIVGNIMDEYDEEASIERSGRDQYVIDGMTKLEELEERFHIDFREEEYDTLNGYMIARMDRIPKEGDTFSVQVGDYLFSIESVSDKHIDKVLVKKCEDKKQEETIEGEN